MSPSDESQKNEKKPDSEKHDQVLAFLSMGMTLVGKVSDKFGVSFAILLLIFVGVWWLGNEKTRDDFIRELLFAGVTGKPYLSVFVGGIALNTIFGISNMLRSFRTEKAEMKRLAEERSRLQEKALDTKLSHTEPAPQSKPDVSAPPASAKTKEIREKKPPQTNGKKKPS